MELWGKTKQERNREMLLQKATHDIVFIPLASTDTQFSSQQESQEVCICLSFELGGRAQITELYFTLHL